MCSPCWQDHNTKEKGHDIRYSRSEAGAFLFLKVFCIASLFPFPPTLFRGFRHTQSSRPNTTSTKNGRRRFHITELVCALRDRISLESHASSFRRQDPTASFFSGAAPCRINHHSHLDGPSCRLRSVQPILCSTGPAGTVAMARHTATAPASSDFPPG
jgi:hypothetical protein